MEGQSKGKSRGQTEEQKQKFTHCNKQNVWSQLQNVFTNYEKIIVQRVNITALKKQEMVKQIQCKGDLDNEVRQIFAEFKNKVQQKMSRIFFQSSVSQIQVVNMKKQLKKSEDQLHICQASNQAQIHQMQFKLKKMQILVKTYERSLINKCLKKQVNEQIALSYQSSANNVLKIKKQLLINHTVNVCIQNGYQSQNLAESKILQFSRLNSSRISTIKENINGERLVLREMEQNWNKSINLSSNRVKSNDKQLLKSVQKELKKSAQKVLKEQAQKGHKNSIQREEKLKGQSQIGDKNFSKSSIKQKNLSAKQNISNSFSKNKLQDREKDGEGSSIISQFVINKIETLKSI